MGNRNNSEVFIILNTCTSTTLVSHNFLMSTMQEERSIFLGLLKSEENDFVIRFVEFYFLKRVKSHSLPSCEPLHCVITSAKVVQLK